jgi:hypothetical protein
MQTIGLLHVVVPSPQTLHRWAISHAAIACHYDSNAIQFKLVRALCTRCNVPRVTRANRSPCKVWQLELSHGRHDPSIEEPLVRGGTQGMGGFRRRTNGYVLST